MTGTATRRVSRAPAAINAVRIIAALQTLLLLGVCAGGVAIAVASARRSSAHRHHGGNSWSDLGVGTGITVAVIGLAAALVVAIPVWRLRPGRPSARSALVIIECVLGVIVLLASAFAVVYALVPVLSCFGVALLLWGSTARAWVDGSVSSSES